MLSLKKSVCALLAAALVCVVPSVPVHAQASDFVIRNGIFEEYRGTGADLVIPSGVKTVGNGNPVTENYKALHTVVIPSGVQTVGSNAFMDCQNLKRVTLPSGLKNIRNNAFVGCTVLPYIRIPNGVTTIEHDAFSGCDNLTSIVIPASVTKMGDNIFYDGSDTGLNNVTIYGISGSTAEKYAKKYKMAFVPISQAETNRLSSYRRNGDFIMDGTVLAEYVGPGGDVTIPAGVTEIGDSAFSQDLTGVRLHGDTPDPDYQQVIEDAQKITSISIPNTVTRIGGRAFFACHGLTNLTIPDSVQDIGYEAFGSCGTHLTTVTFWASNGIAGMQLRYYPKFEKNASTITLPKRMRYFGKNEFMDCWSLHEIVIPEGITSINECMFYGCDNLEKITFPSTIKKIPDNLFSVANSLQTVRGYAGTAAETIAKKSNLRFEKIG